ncbi:hypothetical protein [Paracraurococcus lichenis]|uniref:SWIM-type domain-containing protein n=1 Tax=Paracraurococcus lichenis TaxID=3064888 RepID=A0ABT9E729_9PROT|nr:hypothetical protein [Paracraurococcus sp. LOR1-02]MDO9711992.1 hypothetical protein [Paracraurococcus sp. LOR1-02]
MALKIKYVEQAVFAFWTLDDMIRKFHRNRRAYDQLSWHKAVLPYSYKSGTPERRQAARDMRTVQRALIKWHHTGDHSLPEGLAPQEREGFVAFINHMALAVYADHVMTNDPNRYCRCTHFEHDQCDHTEAERRLKASYELLQAWRRGESVLLLKLAA